MARILVVDDDGHIRHLVATLLVEEGHRVSSVEDGKSALAMIEEDPPDLMILDLMMPDLDGHGVLRQLKYMDVQDELKVLVLTAKTGEADWERSFRMGADHYITKPFGVEDLLKAVDSVLSMSPEQLKKKRQEEIDKAHLLSQLESVFKEV
jgi:DNA-binding response OmpR family regulator